MSVLENVMVGRHPRTRSGFVAGMLNLPRTWREERESRAKAMAILEDLNCWNMRRRRQRTFPSAVSAWWSSRRALATEPLLLLLDEPAAGLNIYETQALARLILKIRDRGVTCLVVEHDMSLS